MSAVLGRKIGDGLAIHGDERVDVKGVDRVAAPTTLAGATKREEIALGDLVAWWRVLGSASCLDLHAHERAIDVDKDIVRQALVRQEGPISLHDQVCADQMFCRLAEFEVVARHLPVGRRIGCEKLGSEDPSGIKQRGL